MRKMSLSGHITALIVMAALALTFVLLMGNGINAIQ